MVCACIDPHVKWAIRNESACGYLHLDRILVADKMCWRYALPNDGGRAGTFRYSLMVVVIKSWFLVLGNLEL